MTDIFDNTILCSKCNTKMTPIQIHKNGFILRAVKCDKCDSKIIHPKDEEEFKNFNELKKKQFNVKMRFVGNSYAVSIPREIVNFMKEQEKIMDDMMEGIPAALKESTLRIVSRKEAIRTACVMAGKEDIILVAGKGHELTQEIAGKKTAFDDMNMLKLFLNG